MFTEQIVGEGRQQYGQAQLHGRAWGDGASTALLWAPVPSFSSQSSWQSSGVLVSMLFVLSSCCMYPCVSMKSASSTRSGHVGEDDTFNSGKPFTPRPQPTWHGMVCDGVGLLSDHRWCQSKWMPSLLCLW